MDKKLSFSISSKPSSSKTNRNPLKTSRTFTDNGGHGNEDHSSHRFITEFDSSDKAMDLNQESSKTHKRIIAPIENEYMPGKRMKNLDLPLRSAARSGGDLDFEADSSTNAANEGAGTNMSYGLNVRQSGKDGLGSEGYEDGQSKKSVDHVLLKKLKKDINRLPDDDVSFDQFEEVPVEGFGVALMAGYGWKDGMGIGKNAKHDAKVVQYKTWVGRGGLGAFSDVDANVNHKDAGNRPDVVKKEKGREEGKHISLGFPVGKELRIIGGRDIGLKGMVMEELSSDGFLLLALSKSKEQVRVSATDVTELGSAKEEKCLQKLEERRHHDSRANKREKDSDTGSDKERKASKRSAEERRKDDVGHVKRDKGSREEKRVSKGSWLRSHIKVRIISQKFKGGRLYLKKGEVLDVVGPTTCDISMDDNKEIIQGVEQDILETALPRLGGRVIVLSGKHKGAYGSLVKKDSASETGVVQDADSQELLNVRLEQIAEYVGDPSDIGY